ncbi:MAG: DUF1343 domain-containing protein [Bacteroidia bacterium]
MKFQRVKLLLFIALLVAPLQTFAQIGLGAEQTAKYLPALTGKKVALVANQTSLVGSTHLLDTLLSLKINVVKVFTPEHGFRGNVSAGEKVSSTVDEKTGVPLVSLYGDNKKPSVAQMQDADVLVFDIQDVGARFYTYISTLHYVMEACAENQKLLVVLDRPNPNGSYIDGPVLVPAFKSFVGMHPVPVVHGMTMGEYAQMINGEGWLANGKKCNLQVIPLLNYTHSTEYDLPAPPSPNLKSKEAICLYPSLCFFEGTNVSVGRGTDTPFEIIGRPGFKAGNFTFTPKSIPGVADNPPYEGKQCTGFSLTNFCREYIMPSREIYLYWLTGFYNDSEDKSKFFNGFFDKLAGTDELRKQIERGESPEDIRKSWQPGLRQYDEMRQKYLLYPLS